MSSGALVKHEEATGTPRRVPVVLPPEEEDTFGLQERTWEELRDQIIRESDTFRTWGKLSPPRRDRKGKKTEDTAEAATTESKNEAPQAENDGGKENGEAADAQNESEKDVAAATPPPTDKKEGEEEEEKSSSNVAGGGSPNFRNAANEKYPSPFTHLPNLANLFESLGLSDEEPGSLPGLKALHAAASHRDPRVVWSMETEMQRRIAARQQIIETSDQEKKQRAKALLEEQKPKKSEHEVFMSEYRRSQEEMRLAADKEKSMIDELDRAAERREKQKENRERDRKEAGDEIKRINAEKRAERSRERQRKIEELRDQEEELNDELLAVQRIRYRFDKAKDEAKKSGDIEKLDDY